MNSSICERIAPACADEIDVGGSGDGFGEVIAVDAALF